MWYCLASNFWNCITSEIKLAIVCWLFTTNDCHHVPSTPINPDDCTSYRIIGSHKPICLYKLDISISPYISTVCIYDSACFLTNYKIDQDSLAAPGPRIKFVKLCSVAMRSFNVDCTWLTVADADDFDGRHLPQVTLVGPYEGGMERRWPSGKWRTVCYGEWPLIDDLPIEKWWFSIVMIVMSVLPAGNWILMD